MRALLFSNLRNSSVHLENMDAQRAIKFVSLDTHPANNALVVSYEIVVSIIDTKSQKELIKRNKRDQLLINITLLDSLKYEDLEQDKLVVNLQELNSKILQKCPLLASMLEEGNSKLEEDIQLNLLYLISRKQSQLLAQVTAEKTETTSKGVKSAQTTNRPPSSASIRLRSARSSLNSRKFSAAGSELAPLSSKSFDDVYSFYRTKLAGLVSSSLEASDLDLFLNDLHEHLSEIVASKSALYNNQKQASLNELESYLEGLYGDIDERFGSIVMIRDLCCCDNQEDDRELIKLGSKRLLICALLRTLRDSSGDAAQVNELREIIFYCLIRFTLYEEIYLKIFRNSQDEDYRIDLFKLLGELFSEQLTKLNRNLLNANNEYYYTNSLLIIILNLLQMKSFSTLEMLVPKHQQQKLSIVSNIIELFNLYAGLIVNKDVNLLNKPGKILKTLNRIIFIFGKLIRFKEFIMLLRSNKKQNFQFIDSIVNLINTSQLTRPNSGVAPKKSHLLISNKLLLNEMYELELNLIEFVNNIIYDTKLRLRLIKRNLLKCVLRNLVVFLSKLSTITPSQGAAIDSEIDQSPVLIYPFRCLYELSCDRVIKFELYKSKIIIKSLLEYLSSFTIEFKSRLELLSRSNIDASTGDEKVIRLSMDEQSVLKPKLASQYLLCIWINLSSVQEASLYNELAADTRDLLDEYFELVPGTCRLYTRSPNLKGDDFMTTYLNLKLVRNVTQFMKQPKDRSIPIKQFAEITNELLLISKDGPFVTPILVESLAIVNNLIESSSADQLNEGPSSIPSTLLENLFSRNISQDMENDDLFLVSIMFLNNYSKKFEICDQLNEFIFRRLIESFNFILDSRLNDTTMMIFSLITFYQLMDHSYFLKNLKVEENAIVDKLINLIGYFNDQRVEKLIILILNSFVQLEEQESIEESLIKRKRFAHHNSKWLNAIQMQSKGDEDDLDKDELGNVIDYDADHLRSFDQIKFQKSERKLEKIEQEEDSSGLEDFEENGTDRSANGSSHSSACLSNQSNQLVPDLNVIDSNSMIKHLTSRREFRLELAKR